MGAAIAGERAPREALRYVPRMSARAWLRAARPLAHANIAPPLVLGQALAYALGHGFDPIFAVFAHGFGVLDHLFIVFANDVADREADAQNDAPTPFSGGSRVLQEGLLSPRQLATGAALAGAGLLALSTAAIAFGRPLTPVFALAAIALLHLRRADSARRAACLRFVLFAAGAIGALHASWSVALFLSR